MSRSDTRMVWLFLTPAIACFGLVFLYPIVQSLFQSFFDIQGFGSGPAPFIGLDNYADVLRSPLFRQSVANILIAAVVGGIAVFGLAFLFMVFLTSSIRGKAFFRAMIYLPQVISVVAITTLWTQYIYNPRYGLLNQVFELLGLTALAEIQWTSIDMLLWSMLIAFVWTTVGWFMLILLAGAQRIPIEYYEAARLDGASTFQMFRRITLPLMSGVIQVALITWVILAVNLFSFPRTWTPGSTQRNTISPAIYLYELVFGRSEGGGGQIGKAAAVAMLMILAVLAYWVISSILSRRERLEY